ncbi:Small acidic protein [Mactra antiquata]
MEEVKIKKKKHKKKCKQDDGDVNEMAECLHVDFELNDTIVTETNNEDVPKSSHKKKKKKNRTREPPNDSVNIETGKEESVITDGSACQKQIKYDIGDVEAVSDEKVKKKKKKKKHRDECNENDDNDTSKVCGAVDGRKENMEESQKPRKKKKHSKKGINEFSNNDDTLDINTKSGELVKTNDSKTNHIDNNEENNSHTSKHKKKRKKHKREENELKSDQEKIVNERELEPPNSKKAKTNFEHDLQNKNACNDFGKNEEGSNYSKTNGSGNEINTGQWSSADLGDQQRQNKFMRLLGGFKKGSDSSQIEKKFGFSGGFNAAKSGSNFSKRPGGNFAMDKQQQDIYTKNLETDYERAMKMNLNRGIGLGFEKPPEEGKKFYIDTSKSKSIKFDD